MRCVHAFGFSTISSYPKCRSPWLRPEPCLPPVVQVTQAEIEMGLRAHPHVPGLLLDWLQKEAVGGNAVVLGDE